MYRDTARHWHHPWLRIELAIRALVGAYLIYFASHPRLDIHDIRRIEAGRTRAIDLLDQWHPDLAAAFPYQTRQSRIVTCMDKEISR